MQILSGWYIILAMIKSETIIIEKTNNFDDTYIEQQLKKIGKTPLRWAVVGIDEKNITVSVSY